MGEPNQAPPLTPRAKVWLEIEGEYVFGLGICRILEAIEETGSIKEAATKVGKSYRHVWARIRDVEKRLGIQFVVTQVGGSGPRRSQLTPAAHDFINCYVAMRRDVFSIVEQRFSQEIAKVMEQARNASSAET